MAGVRRGAQQRAAGLLAVVALAAGYTPPTKYLIISNARSGTIGYTVLSRDGGNCSGVQTLIDRDLAHPQGLAVDQKRQLLLVADSQLRKVVSYGLTVHEDGSLAVDEQTPVAEDVEARWVAVDGPGNVFITDELGDRLLQVTAQQVLDGDTAVRPVFAEDAASKAAISAPGGIATDNFHLFWTNKVLGQKVGTLMKAMGSWPNSSSAATIKATAMAKNADQAYGVCLAMDSLYFTAHDREVYAVKTKGGDVVTVSSALRSPRGCAWDGESTVYVADRTADGIFALHGPTLNLAHTTASKVCHFEGAFGVAVFSFAPTKGMSVWLLPLLISSLLAQAALI